MAVRTARQLVWRRRVERGIRVVAPVLDLVLAAGDRVSRVAGRRDLDPEPARHPRTSIGGAPRQP